MLPTKNQEGRPIAGTDNVWPKKPPIVEAVTTPQKLAMVQRIISVSYTHLLIKGMEQKLSKAMSEHFAPDEQWMRLGLDK